MVDENSSEIQQVSYKLVILGDIAVGKSSIAKRFVNGKFETLHEPTIGALFLTKKINIQNYVAKLEIWDTAGQERYHALTPMYYRNANAAVVVFDVTNPQSYERAQKWVSELLEKANSGIVIAICGNKVDLDENRKVNAEEVKKYAEQIGSFYLEVSAKINLNIDKLFEDIANKLPKKVQHSGERIEEIQVEKPHQGCTQC